MINSYINSLIAGVTKSGKKNIARRVVLNCLVFIRNKKKEELSSFFKKSFSNCQPKISFKNKKIAGAVYKIPKPYNNLDNYSIGSKWIITNASKKSEHGFSKKLSSEILDSFENKSLSVKKKKELHKVALANRPNLKYM